MKVLHLLKTAVGATWALRQTTHLVKLGVEVHLALPDGPMVEKYRAAGVHVHIFDPALNLAKPWKNISTGIKLRRLVKHIQPDIVHSHFVATTLLMRLALKGINLPRIFHIPGPLHLEHRFYRGLDIHSSTKNDYHLASCKWTQHALVDFGVNKERVGLAYYGVNAEDFQPVDSSQQINLRSQLGWSEDTLLIGMVAYFYSPKTKLGQTRGLKGHEDLIDAVVLLNESHPNIRCVFVGGSWEDSEDYFVNVQNYANAKSDSLFAFLGTRTNVPQLYRQFDIAVHPSHSENLGGAVESMYAGVLTITSSVGGFPDLVEDKVTGYMAPPMNPVALSKKIAQAIESRHLWSDIIDRASRKVASVMNVEQNAQEVLAFYRHVLSIHK